MELRELTATVYIVEEKKFLLIHHPKYKKWMPPGGHVEENETPAEAARREVEEEAGLKIEFLAQEKVEFKAKGVVQIERPFFCFLYDVPAYKDIGPHQHIDMIFLARPAGFANQKAEEECCWFTFEEMQNLEKNKEIFPEIIEIVAAINRNIK